MFLSIVFDTIWKAYQKLLYVFGFPPAPSKNCLPVRRRLLPAVAAVYSLCHCSYFCCESVTENSTRCSFHCSFTGKKNCQNKWSLVSSPLFLVIRILVQDLSIDEGENDKESADYENVSIGHPLLISICGLYVHLNELHGD